jgi:hypothetical protein
MTDGTRRNHEPWWAKKEPHDALVALVREQYDNQHLRYATFRRYASIYEFSYRAAERLSKGKQVDDEILAYNRAANTIDTVLAQTCAARILPMCSTDGGTYDEQQLAEEAQRALEGVFDEVEFDEKFEEMARDAEASSGTGFIKIYPDFDAMCVRADRVPPDDMIFDEAETRYGDPRCFYQRIVIDRYVAADLYGRPRSEDDDALVGSGKSRKEAILDAPEASAHDDEEPDEAMIEIFEGWRRPSIEAANDNDGDEDDDAPKRKHKTCGGRRVVAIQGVTLEDDDDGEPPFVWYTPKRSFRGFWGIPLMRYIISAQREGEVLDDKLQRAHNRIGGSNFLAPKSAGMGSKNIGNGVGRIFEYEGQIPPSPFTPDPVNPQTYQYRETIANDMLRFTGQSSMAARGDKPAGLNAGKAIMAYADETSRYNGNRFRARERVVKRATKLILDAIEKLVERDPGLTARLRDGSGYRTIPWKRILEIRHKLVWKTTPINALTQNWVGRQQTVDSWFNSGAIDANRWRKLSEIPDLAAQNAQDMAFGDLIESQLSKMVRTGEYSSPEPFYPLEEAKTIAAKFYCMCVEQGVSEPRLKLIRDFIQDCDRLAQPPEAPPGAPAGIPPTDGGTGLEAMPPDMGMGMPPSPDMMMPPANGNGEMPPMVA